MSLIVGCTIADKQLAVALTPVLVVPMMLFAGFFVTFDKIPIYLKPIGYMSFFKYGFQCLAQIEYDGLHLACMDETDQAKKCDPLNELDIKEEFYVSILCLVGMIFVFNSIALIIMIRLSGKYE